MKIWIICQNNSLPEHGHFNRHFNFAKQLKQLGYEPTLFFGSNPHNTNTQIVTKGKSVCIDDYGFDTVYVKTIIYNGSMKKRLFAMLQFVKNCKAVAKKYAKEKGVPDVIIGSSAHPFNVTLALKLAKKYKCKSVCEVRDLWPESIVTYGVASAKNPLVKWLYRLEKKIYTKADKIVFTMAGGAQYIKDKKMDTDNGGPIDLNKVYNINNGVDLEQFNYNKEHFKVEDSDLDDDKTFKVIYTGSLRKANNLDFVLDVAKKMQDSNKKVVFLIYGSGNYLDSLIERTKNEEIKNVIFKGKVEKKCVPYILSKCDLSLLVYKEANTQKYGGSQNKLFEYLTAGLPVISNIEEGFSVMNSSNVGLVSKNLDEISEYISNLQKDKKAYKKISDNAKNLSQEYDFKTLTQKLIDVIGGEK